MSLLAAVVGILNRAGVHHAVIGAAAMAVHRVARSTLDIDLLTTDGRCLEPHLWGEIRAGGGSVDIRRGDAADPLVGVARIESHSDRTVDLVVGRARWQSRAVERACPRMVGGVTLPVCELADLILLKLYAGGAQDRWDIEQLLAAADDRDAVAAQVDSELDELPVAAGELWRSLR